MWISYIRLLIWSVWSYIVVIRMNIHTIELNNKRMNRRTNERMCMHDAYITELMMEQTNGETNKRKNVLKHKRMKELMDWWLIELPNKQSNRTEKHIRPYEWIFITFKLIEHTYRNERTIELTNKRMNKREDERKNGRTNGRTKEWTKKRLAERTNV